MSNFQIQSSFNAQASMRYGAAAPSANLNTTTAATSSAYASAISMSRGGFAAASSSSFQVQSSNQFQPGQVLQGFAGAEGATRYASAHYNASSSGGFQVGSWSSRSESMSTGFSSSVHSAVSGGAINAYQAGYLAGLGADIQGMTGAFAGPAIDSSPRFGFMGSPMTSASYSAQASYGVAFRGPLGPIEINTSVGINQSYSSMQSAFGQMNHLGGVSVGAHFAGIATDPRVGGLQTQLSAYGSTLNQFAGQLGKLHGGLDVLGNKVGAQGQDISYLKGAFSGLGDRVSDLSARVGTNQAQTQAGLASLDSKLNAYQSANDSRVGSLEGKLAATQTATDSRVSTLEGKLAATQAANDARATAQDKTIADLKNMLTELSSKLNTVDNRVTTEVAGLKSQIAGLDTKLTKAIADGDSALKTQLETEKQALLAKLGAEVARLDAKVDTVDSRVTTEVVKLNDRISAVDSKLGAEIKALDGKFSTEVAKLKAADSEMAAKFEGLQQQVNAQGEQLAKQLELIQGQGKAMAEMKTDLQGQLNGLKADQVDTRAKLEQQIRELDAAQSDIGNLQSGLESAKKEYTAGLQNLGNQIASANQRIDQVNGRVDAVKGELDAKITQTQQQLQGSINNLQGQVNKNAADIAKVDTKLDNTVNQMNEYLAAHPDMAKDVTVQAQVQQFGYFAVKRYRRIAGVITQVTTIVKNERDTKTTSQIDPNQTHLTTNTEVRDTTTVQSQFSELIFFNGKFRGLVPPHYYAVAVRPGMLR